MSASETEGGKDLYSAISAREILSHKNKQNNVKWMFFDVKQLAITSWINQIWREIYSFFNFKKISKTFCYVANSLKTILYFIIFKCMIKR